MTLVVNLRPDDPRRAPALGYIRLHLARARGSICASGNGFVNNKTTTCSAVLLGQAQYLDQFSHIRGGWGLGIGGWGLGVGSLRRERWEGVAFRRLPRVHRQDHLRICPATFAAGRGKLSSCPVLSRRRAKSRREAQLQKHWVFGPGTAKRIGRQLHTRAD